MNNKTLNIYTKRLYLVPLSIKYLADYYVNWMNDTDVTRHLETGGDYTLLKLKKFLIEVEQSNAMFWAIHLRENNKHIGNIKIDPINQKHNYGEYGIMIGDKTVWGKGYATEATLGVINFCFGEEIGLRKINLGVRFSNTRAVELYKKIGFIEEGKFVNHVISEDGYDDVLRMAIFNPNY